MIGVVTINKLMNRLWYLRQNWSLGFHIDFTAVPPGIIFGLTMQNDKPSPLLSAVKVNMTHYKHTGKGTVVQFSYTGGVGELPKSLSLKIRC